jgi:peptidoglycan/xylan/chitin deacetylase (PgdA/CDA1 family)
LRTLLKHSLETILCRGGFTAAARAARRGGTLVLAYHDVVPHGGSREGDRSLHLSQRDFARQLELIARTHDVVPLADLLDSPQPARRPRAVVTFDDAYRGAVTAGVEELARRGLPATIFVTPGFLDGGSFWWDVLARPGQGGLAPEVRDRCLGELGGRDARIRRWAEGAGLPLREPPPHQTGATEAELRTAAATPGITLGAHTWSHPSLPALSAEELEDEMARPLAWLRERFAGVLPWLSYPYGHTSPAVEDAARRAGYRGAFRVDGGWMPRDPAGLRLHALPRSNIPAGGSLENFELRTSGLLAR